MLHLILTLPDTKTMSICTTLFSFIPIKSTDAKRYFYRQSIYLKVTPIFLLKTRINLIYNFTKLYFKS